MIRVLLADDQALIRAGYKMILDAEDDIEVVGEAVNGAGTSPGQGLLGMRERVASHGGEIEAGSGPDGGFVVRASLPFDE